MIGCAKENASEGNIKLNKIHVTHLSDGGYVYKNINNNWFVYTVVQDNGMGTSPQRIVYRGNLLKDINSTVSFQEALPKDGSWAFSVEPKSEELSGSIEQNILSQDPELQAGAVAEHDDKINSEPIKPDELIPNQNQ